MKPDVEEKNEILKRNYYHIDGSGKLVKGDMFIPMINGGKTPKIREPNYF